MQVTPDRVAVSAHGDRLVEAESPRRAAARDLALTEFVFVRDDGWALGACGKFAPAAFRAWADQWVAVFRVNAGDQVVEILKPEAFIERLVHFARHATIAVDPYWRLGDQVGENVCASCGWKPIDEGANVPDKLIEDLMGGPTR